MKVDQGCIMKLLDKIVIKNSQRSQSVSINMPCTFPNDNQDWSVCVSVHVSAMYDKKLAIQGKPISSWLIEAVYK